MVVLLHHPTLLIPMVKPELLQQIHTSRKELQPPRRQPLPNLQQPRLNPVSSKHEFQTKVYVRLQQLLPIALPPTPARRVNHPRYPLPTPPYPRRMHRRLRMRPVMLAVRIRNIRVPVPRQPYRRRPIPPDIHPINPRPPRRQLKRLANNIRLRHRVNRTNPQTRDTLRPRVNLMRQITRRQALPPLLVQVRCLRPSHEHNRLAHGCTPTQTATTRCGFENRPSLRWGFIGACETPSAGPPPARQSSEGD